MVARAPELDALRERIQSTSGAFLNGVKWLPDVTCSVCAGIPGPGYSTCYKCNQRLAQPGIADQLGFITYAWNGHQSGRMMYAYKETTPGPNSLWTVRALLSYALVGHWECLTRRGGGSADLWSYVPSLSGRPGQHPLHTIGAGVLQHVEYHPLIATPGATKTHTFRPENFTAPPTTAQHVVLLEDSWFAGGNAQSASAALKKAGAKYVTILTVARWLDLGYGDTAAFQQGLRGGFDPNVCPYTGDYC